MPARILEDSAVIPSTYLREPLHRGVDCVLRLHDPGRIVWVVAVGKLIAVLFGLSLATAGLAVTQQEIADAPVPWGWVMAIAGTLFSMLLVLCGALLMWVFNRMQGDVAAHAEFITKAPERFMSKEDWKIDRAELKRVLERMDEKMGEEFRRLFEKLDGKADKRGSDGD